MSQGTVGVSPGTTTVKLSDGTVISLRDWIDDSYFSAVQLSNAQQAQVEAFAVGRSQPIPGGTRPMSRVDTNVPRAGDSGLPQGYAMLVYAICVRCNRVCRAAGAQPVLGDFSDPPTLRTLFNINRVTALRFEYNNKEFTTGQLEYYPQGSGYSLFTTAANIELAQNGIPSPRDRASLVLPIYLRDGISYKMQFQPETALAIAQAASDGGAVLGFADFVVRLVGLIQRPIT